MSENYKSPYRELKLNARARPKAKRAKVLDDTLPSCRLAGLKEGEGTRLRILTEEGKEH